MNSDPSSSNTPKINLLDRFPHLKPMRSTPPLTTVNGIGFGLYGHRDADAETGAYVKTLCFCVFFIPLLACGAYRVVDARERGWYFLGREPLSPFAKLWNAFMVCLLAAGIGAAAWNSHVTSPAYVARANLRAANALLQSGNGLRAAESFRVLLTGPVSVEAAAGLRAALELCLQSPSVVTNEGAFRILARVGPVRANSFLPDAAQRGLTLVDKIGNGGDPEGALRLLDAVALVDPKNETIRTRRVELLQAVVAAQPDNVSRLVELALVYEQAEEMKKCYALLEPQRQRLGSTEGARILGQHLLREGRHDDAYELLHPYVQARLARLHEVERTYTNAVSSCYQAALNHLRFNKADPSFYQAYKDAPKATQEQMVENFVRQWMQNDATYKRALEQLKDANQIVHVTLDLGIVQLSRAQNFPDPARRKLELEETEKTFLAIRGLAGETAEYRLFLGQVYYWLGRAAEGKQLFDQLLASEKRSPAMLLALGSTLREIGEDKQARQLLEEAYRSAEPGKTRYRAANLRAAAANDAADKIVWLEKADPSEAATQVALNNARGEQGLEQGNKEAAAGYLRKAIAGYENMPRTSAVLNNSGLACLSLYGVTGRQEDLNRGLNLLEQAVALEPGNSILLVNTIQVLISRAVADGLRENLRLDLLKEQPDLDAFAFLYNNETQRREVYQRLRAHESMKKAMVYLDRALVLAPKSPSLYREQLFFLGAFEDVAELQKLQQRVRVADLDPAELQRESREAWMGTRDKEFADKLQTQIRKYEALLQSEGVRQHPGTLEYVIVSLNNTRLAAGAYGAPVDTRKVLETAAAAYEKHRCSATRRSLEGAYSTAALEELSRQDSDVAQVVKRTARFLPPRYVLTLLLERGGSGAETVRRNQNLGKLVALVKEGGHEFRSGGDPEDWALFRTIDRDAAAQAAQGFKGNATTRLMHELNVQLIPATGQVLLDQYWSRKMQGDDAGALKTYEQAVRIGAPLPPLPRPETAAVEARSPGAP